MKSGTSQRLPAHHGMRCYCHECESRWWATALAVALHPRRCPFCGEPGYSARAED